MPWKYVLPTDVDSLREREATVARILNFWNEFAQKLPEIEAHLSGEAQWDLAGWMSQAVAEIHPRLRWEFGQDLSGRYLVITCETAHHLRPMTETVCRSAAGGARTGLSATIGRHVIPKISRLSSAPAPDCRWARPPSRRASGTTAASTSRSKLISPAPTKPPAMAVARAACDYLIGEDTVQRWLGHLDVVEISHASQNFVPVSRVRSLVLELVGTVLGGLPDRPYWKMPQLSMIESKFKPERREDYANQDDAMFGTSVIPELRIAGFKPGFCSCRFSRQGETFCYLKLDASDVELEERYKRKKVIEESLDAKLRDDGIGAVVGTATGRKYLYFDLAVTDVVKTFEAIRRRLLALELLPVR